MLTYRSPNTIQLHPEGVSQTSSNTNMANKEIWCLSVLFRLEYRQGLWFHQAAFEKSKKLFHAQNIKSEEITIEQLKS